MESLEYFKNKLLRGSIMTELYFGIKLVGYAIVIGLFVLIFLAIFIKCLISSIKESRVEKYLISIGYKRELISTASVGTNHTYGYKRLNNDSWNDIVRDYELKGVSLKQVKQKYT
jgi:hypothetical protein